VPTPFGFVLHQGEPNDDGPLPRHDDVSAAVCDCTANPARGPRPPKTLLDLIAREYRDRLRVRRGGKSDVGSGYHMSRAR